MSTRALWTGRPWILPGVATRSVLVIAVAIAAFWLEFQFSIATQPFLNVPIALWTSLVLFLSWLLSMPHLLALRASNKYILRNDSLEIRMGILTSKSFVIAPSGFSDLEVTQSFSARIMNLGDITIRTQGDTDIRMQKVKNPLKVADKIREVMARPTIRIDKQELIKEHPQEQSK
jgi:membrane protein YdbS with pleckstrin-like domain